MNLTTVSMVNFKALEITESPENNFTGKISNKMLDEIQNGNILIRVEYSSLNYKDCLSIAGHKGVTRNYPHIPGIDCAGEVMNTKSSKFNIGDKVIVTGYDLGMNHPGGFSEYVEVPQEWVVVLPKQIDFRQAMMFGTAGFTAMAAILSLENHFNNLLDVKQKNILVTGIAGGVGSISCLLLKELGYEVIGATRNVNNSYLSNLAIDQVINSEILTKEKNKPLLERLYAGVIDNLGGVALENIVKYTSYNGIVVACGNAFGITFNSTVFPFILRAITLKGISSANTIMEERKIIWNKIAKFKEWNKLAKITTEITLDQVVEKSKLILEGKHQGHFIVKIR